MASKENGTHEPRTFAQTFRNLMHSDPSVRWTAHATLLKLSKKAEFQRFIDPVVPQIIGLLNDDDWRVRRAAVNTLARLSEQAEFRPLMGPFIPQIIELLQDSTWEVGLAAVKAMWELSEQAEFRRFTGPSIPHIVTLFNDSDRGRGDDEEGVDFRPLKKGKLAGMRKNPQDFVAMQRVMKFDLA